MEVERIDNIIYKVTLSFGDLAEVRSIADKHNMTIEAAIKMLLEEEIYKD